MIRYDTIEIKSDSDLPTKDGLYFVYLDVDYDNPLDVFRWANDEDNIRQLWRDFVKYWLKPQTEETGQIKKCPD